ncbi:hypothetical protein ACX1HO_22110 [Yersinia enterocolitica]|nr:MULTISPECIES: hypothetical protein [Yersinia]MBW5812583.1 hypothetical protein [Yersinia kristensenii]MBW5829884.1 hypothetical protein [Yersinia kristensenii]OWF74467.1 hypothetical protein B4907_22020 [Yersinia kristensenii]
MNFFVTELPTDTDKELIMSKIVEYNNKIMPDDTKELCVFYKNDTGKILGDITGILTGGADDQLFLGR